MIDFQTKTFDNGLRLITAPSKLTESVAALILVGAGGRFEKRDKIGTTHFLEHLFFKGSKNYPSAFQISKELDAIGAYYNAHPGEESTVYYVQSGAKDFQKTFGVLSDMFLNPIFDEQEIEQEKQVIIAEINMHKDIPQSRVSNLNQAQMFGTHPLGYDLAGSEKSILSSARDDIIDFRKSLYTPSNTIVAIVGNPENFNWEDEVNKLFSGLQDSKIPSAAPFTDKKVENRLISEVRKLDQTHLVMSYLGLSRDDPRRYVQNILSAILGSGMSSRLFMEIREKRGLAYYVQTANSFYKETGLISIYAGVHPHKTTEAIELILKELTDLAQQGPNDEELQRAKGNLRGSLALSLENSSDMAAFFANDLLFMGKIRQVDEINRAHEKVTSGDIQKLAEEIFASDRMGLSIIGPKSYKENLKYLI